MENVQTQVIASGPAEDTTITRTAVNVRTPKGMTVQYSSTAHLVHGEEESFSESYTSQSSDQTYRAQGGHTRSLQKAAPQLALKRGSRLSR